MKKLWKTGAALAAIMALAATAEMTVAQVLTAPAASSGMNAKPPENQVKINLDLKDTPLEQALDKIATLGSITIIKFELPADAPKINLLFKNVTATEAAKQAAGQAKLNFRDLGDALLVSPKVDMAKLEKGDGNISWEDAKLLLTSGEMKFITQTHSRHVSLTLKNGRNFKTIEPEIDLVFKIAKTVRCQVMMATE